MLTSTRPARALAVFLGLAVSLAACSKGGDKAEPAADKGDVVVTVNGRPVHQEEVSQMVQILQQQDFVPPDSIAEGVTREEKQRNFAVDRLVERLLILEDAEKRGLAPTADAVEAGLPQYKQARGLADSLPAGVTEDDVRKGMVEDMTIKTYVDSTIMPGIQVTDADMQNFYDENPSLFEQVHASHILIRADANASDTEKAEARKKAQNVLDQLNNGKDFAELARQYSEDPRSGQNGGDLGFFGRGQMVPAFENAAFSLKPGQVSGIVESDFGYHIIKTLEKKKLTLDEIKPRMSDFLSDRKVAMAMETRLKELRDQAKIEKKTS